MPSFDVVSQVDMAEVKNAVAQSLKEIGQRYDFRGSRCTIEEQKEGLQLVGDDDYKLNAVKEILMTKLTRRNVEVKNLEFGKVEPGANQTLKQMVKIQQGIPQEQAKEIIREIKDSGLKVQSQIQGEQLRITGKKKDDLQEVMAFLRKRPKGVALQFVNFRD